MANKFTYQVLRDTQTDSVIKLTGVFDSTAPEMNLSRIQANTLNNALATNGYLLANSTSQFANTPLSYYDLQITGVKYYVNFPTNSTPGGIEIFWSGNNATGTYASGYANSATIFHLNLQGEFGLGEQLPSILNNSGDGVHANTIGNGDIGIQTTGGVANAAYTLIITLRKNNAMYQRGQFNDPAAFNYKPAGYGVTP
jgi:hypothetical protein